VSWVQSIDFAGQNENGTRRVLVRRAVFNKRQNADWNQIEAQQDNAVKFAASVNSLLVYSIETTRSKSNT
jgi:hypothetical protein